MATFEEKLDEAKRHIRFGCMLYRLQMEAGRYVVHEQPWTARSWDIPEVRRLSEDMRVMVVQTHPCRFGFKATAAGTNRQDMFGRKPVGFMTSSWLIPGALHVKCTRAREHAWLTRGRGAKAATYPTHPCEAICLGIQEQTMFDADNTTVGSTWPVVPSPAASATTATLFRAICISDLRSNLVTKTHVWKPEGSTQWWMNLIRVMRREMAHWLRSRGQSRWNPVVVRRPRRLMEVEVRWRNLMLDFRAMDGPTLTHQDQTIPSGALRGPRDVGLPLPTSKAAGEVSMQLRPGSPQMRNPIHGKTECMSKIEVVTTSVRGRRMVAVSCRTRS